MTQEQENFAEEKLESGKSEAIHGLNEEAAAQTDGTTVDDGSGGDGPASTIPLEEKKENGYIPGTASVDQPGYAEDLAARIVASDFPVTRVAFLDYKALYAAGQLADSDTNNPLPLKTGQRLSVDKTPDCARGTYWNHVE